MFTWQKKAITQQAVKASFQRAWEKPQNNSLLDFSLQNKMK